MPAAKGKRTEHQRPVATNGAITAHHEVAPTELDQHPLVALFDPVTKSVQPYDLLQGRRQVRREIPGGQRGQCAPVGRGANRPDRAARAIAQQRQPGRPPTLSVPVPKPALHRAPGTQRQHLCRIVERVGCLGWRPASPERPPVRQHIGQAVLDKRRLQGLVVAIKAVRNDRVESDARSLRLLDQGQRDLRLGAKCRILPSASRTPGMYGITCSGS